jgi:hypothetical protein
MISGDEGRLETGRHRNLIAEDFAIEWLRRPSPCSRSWLLELENGRKGLGDSAHLLDLRAFRLMRPDVGQPAPACANVPIVRAD